MKKEMSKKDSKMASSPVAKVLRKAAQYGRSFLTVWELRQVYMHAEGKKDDFVRDLWTAEQCGDVLIQDGRVYLSNAEDVRSAPAGKAAIN